MEAEEKTIKNIMKELETLLRNRISLIVDDSEVSQLKYNIDTIIRIFLSGIHFENNKKTYAKENKLDSLVVHTDYALQALLEIKDEIMEQCDGFVIDMIKEIEKEYEGETND